MEACRRAGALVTFGKRLLPVLYIGSKASKEAFWTDRLQLKSPAKKA